MEKDTVVIISAVLSLIAAICSVIGTKHVSDESWVKAILWYVPTVLAGVACLGFSMYGLFAF